MPKFERCDSRRHIAGLAEAARQIQIDELIRAGKMPSLDQVLLAVEETKKNYRSRILAARQKKSNA